MRDSGRTTSGAVGRRPERQPGRAEAQHTLARSVAIRGTAGFGTPRWPALDARALLAASRIWIFLLPVLAAGALSIALGPDNSWDLRYYHVAAAILALTIAMVTTVHLDWGRGDFGDKYVEVSVPPLPRDSIVLVATWDPVAYFIPFVEPKAQYVGIENNYLELSQHNELAAKVKRLMAAPDRSKFILSVGTFDWRELDSLLQRFGLRLAKQPCQDIHSNLEVHALRLCRVASE